MRGEDWFKSPPRRNRPWDSFHYANLMDPSPLSANILFPAEPQVAGQNTPIRQRFATVMNIQEELVNEYWLPILVEETVKVEAEVIPMIKQQQPDLTLSWFGENMQRPKKYNIRSQFEKKIIVEESFTLGLNYTCRKFNVSVNNICRWRRDCKRRSGAGRKVTDPEMESKLVEWIQEHISSKTPLNRMEVRTKAKEITMNKHFKGSKGWFDRLMVRHPHLRDYVEK